MAFDILTYTSINKFFLDHLAKTVFDYVEHEHGSDNDNAYKDVTIPFMCDGWFKGRTNYSAEYFDPWNTYVTCDYMFHMSIDGNYNTENFIDLYQSAWTDSKYGNVSIEDAYNHIRNSSTTGSYLDHALAGLDHAQQQAEEFALRLNDGMSQQKIFSAYTNFGTGYWTQLYTINQNTKILDSFTRYNIYQNPPVSVLNTSKIKFQSTASITNLAIAHSQYAVDTDIGFDRTYNLFAIADNNTASVINNNQNTTYHNTFNYTTNNGDTITVYYGDNYIDLGIGPSGALGAGALVGFNYNDFKLIMDDLIDDLKINSPGLEIPQDYQFPSYDDIKYEDMGDFYIEPLHQYDKLPTAPTYDGTLDLQDFPRAVGLFAGAYLDLIPAGLGALMTGIFILCIILNNLRGRG